MLSSESIGHLIWGSSCLILILFVLIYDGILKRDIRIISSIFLSYLSLQIVISTVYILYDSLTMMDTMASILSFIATVSVILSGTLFLMMSSILILSPLHKNRLMRITIFILLPFIFLSLCSILSFMSPTKQLYIAYFWLISCGIIAYLTFIVLYHWFNQQKFIFAVYDYDGISHLKSENENIYELANWKLYFPMALCGATIVVLINIIYPLVFVHYGVIPETVDPVLIVRICDSVVFLPLVTPLFRSLDKVIEYSKYRIMQNVVSDPSDDEDDEEQEPLQEQEQNSLP